MKQLIYTSIAAPGLPREELIAILKSAQRRNAERNVSGILLYNEHFFCQCLEGEAEDVDAIYKLIQLDQRHSDLMVYLNRTVTERDFAEWSMGYVDGTDPEMIALLESHGMRAGFLPHTTTGPKQLELLKQSRQFIGAL